MGGKTKVFPNQKNSAFGEEKVSEGIEGQR